jgi:hypothetical protein
VRGGRHAGRGALPELPDRAALSLLGYRVAEERRTRNANIEATQLMAKDRKPAQSDFPPLTWDQPFWTARIVLPAWKGFQSRQGPYGAVSSKARSGGAARLYVTPPDGKEQAPPSADQVRAYQYLLDHQEAVRDAILNAILETYPGMQDSYGYDEEEAAEFMPPVERPEQFKPLIGLSVVHVLKVANGGLACVGFEFGCTWDTEHGLGVMTHKDRIIKVGGADTSFLEWIAEQDIRPEKKRR